MSDISTKLTYLNTTKTNLKDMINYGLPSEEQITSSTTFRNYVSSIFEAFLESLRDSETLYTNLPKKSGNGTQITLNDTAYSPMRITLGSSALEQTTYTGKNLLETKIGTQTKNGITLTHNTDGTYTINGTTTAGTTIRSNTYSKTLSGGTYTLSVENALPSGVYYSIYNNGTEIKAVSHNAQSTTLTLNESTTYSDFADNIYINNGVTFNNFVIKPQLEKGSTATAYEPYVGGTASPNPSYPQDIHTISGSNSIVVEGKNLLDTSYLVEANANKTYNGYGFWAFKLTDELGTYTLSRANNTMYADGKYLVIGQGSDLATAYNNKEWLMHPSLSNLNNKSRTITNTGELWLFTGNSKVNIDTMLSYAGYLQLEYGNQATTYEPYQSNTQTIDLSTYNLGSIGNYENKFIRSGGENLCDYDINTDYTSQYLDNSGNWVTAVGSVYVKQKINITSKIISIYIGSMVGNGYVRLGQFKSDGTFITRTLITSTTNNITLDNNCSYIWLSIDKNLINNIYFENISIVYGSTATFVPYEKGWYYKEGIGKVVLDGSEDWGSFAIEPSGLGRSILVISDIKINATNLMYMSDKLQSANYSGSWNLTYDNIAVVSNEPKLIMYLQNVSTLEDFTTWLGTNTPKVYYVKEAPTYTKLTDTTLINQLENTYKNMLSYKGTTNISQVNNDLPFTLSVSAIEDLS